MLQIVVAKYKEDITWTYQLDNVLIYNKGDDKVLYSMVLPNIGREAHTYLYHIVNNYDNLADWTCFLQGNPLDHCPDIIEKIKTCNFKDDIYFFGTRLVEYTLDGCPGHTGLKLKELYHKIYKESEYSKNISEMRFMAGAQFIVSKELIHKRPKTFYQKLITIMNESVEKQEPWIYERFWPIVFGFPTLDKYNFIEHL